MIDLPNIDRTESEIDVAVGFDVARTGVASVLVHQRQLNRLNDTRLITNLLQWVYRLSVCWQEYTDEQDNGPTF